jgi:hypothetical protein
MLSMTRWWALAALWLVGCQTTKAPMAKLWLERGDAALEQDPGRALSNYQQAATAWDRHSVSGLEEKQREAAFQWLRRELQASLAREPDWREQLALVDQLHYTARELGVAERLEPELFPIERRALSTGYAERKAALLAAPHGPWEQAVRFAEFARTVPAGAVELRADADAEAARRQAGLLQLLESTKRHPFVQARLLAAAKALSKAPEAVPVPPAPQLRISWTAEATGCAGVEAALKSLAREPAAHRGTLRLSVTCEVKPHVEQVTRKETVWREEKVKTTSMVTRCESLPDQYTCLNYSGGECKGGVQREFNRARCSQVPETRVEIKRVPVVKEHKETLEFAIAKARGTLVVEVDGVSRTIPVEQSSRTSGRPTEALALAELASFSLASLVEQTARELEQAILRRHLESLEALLATDETQAEQAFVLALGAGARRADLPKGVSRLAERDLLPMDAWLAVVVEQRAPFAEGDTRPLDWTRPVERLSPPSPDLEGVERWEKERQRESDEANAALWARRAAREEDDFKLGFFAAPTHWYTYGGNGSLGLNLGGYVRGGGELGDLPLFYSYKAALTVETDFGEGITFGLGALGRLGAGLRLTRFYLAPFAAVGASSRARVIPWGLEVGAGLRVGVRVAERGVVELLGERISRPLIDGAGPSIIQRLHYELRYVHQDTEGNELGLGLGCAFHQDGAADFVLPLSGVRGRLCDLNGFMAF